MVSGQRARVRDDAWAVGEDLPTAQRIEERLLVGEPHEGGDAGAQGDGQPLGIGADDLAVELEASPAHAGAARRETFSSELR